MQNGVLVLDGIRDAVSVPRIGDADAVFSQFTVSMWVYPTADLSSLEFSGGINTDVWAAGAMHFKFHYGALNVGINGLDGGDLEGVSMGVTNAWNHIAVTVSETEIALYLNGGLEDSRALAAPIDVILGSASLGAWNNTDAISREMTGQMDNVRIYDRALSEGQILFLADLQERGVRETLPSRRSKIAARADRTAVRDHLGACVHATRAPILMGHDRRRARCCPADPADNPVVHRDFTEYNQGCHARFRTCRFQAAPRGGTS